MFSRPPRRHRGRWQSSLGPSPTHAEVRSTHLDLPVNPDVYSAIGPVLTTRADDHDPVGERSGTTDSDITTRTTPEPPVDLPPMTTGHM